MTEPEAPPEKPLVRTWADLTSLREVVHDDAGPYPRSMFAVVDKNDYVWAGHAAASVVSLTLEQVNHKLELVWDEEVYPLATPLISSLQIQDLDVFIKRPKLHLDNDLPPQFLAEIFYEEAQLLEFLARHPHPNLVRYLGCTVKRSRITGIALERHVMTLQDRSRSGFHKLDQHMLIDQIRRGTKHLHALGFAHNDINPSNIALDNYDRPILLDFGSCKRFGERLRSAGTPGWADEFYTSEPEHDEIAIERIAKWLAEKHAEEQNTRQSVSLDDM